MSDKNSILPLIDDYLSGNLSEEALHQFEEKMANDTAVAAMVDEARLTNEALHFAELGELRETIANDISSIPYKPSTNHLKTWGLIALLLTAGVVGYFIWKSSTNSTQNLEAVVAPNSDRQTTDIQSQDSSSVRDSHSEKTASPSATDKTSPPIPKTPTDQGGSLSSSSDTLHGLSTISDTRRDSVTENTLPTLPKVDPAPTKTSDKIPNAAQTDNICNASFELTSTPSCKNKETGKVSASYNNELNVEFTLTSLGETNSHGNFYDLEAGTYEVVMNYAKNCKSLQTVTVQEKWCPLNDPFSFNPDYDRWEPTYEKGDRGTFTIFTHLGREVFSGEFGDGGEFWNGRDKQGRLQPTGSYLAIISYPDGRKETVELTIIQ